MPSALRHLYHLANSYNEAHLAPSLRDVSTIKELYEHVSYWERSRDAEEAGIYSSGEHIPQDDLLN
jgi:hypothetical protein